jgi:ABC-type iron transport system FetAB permease component
VFFNRGLRRELLESGFTTVVNLLLMGVLLDSVFQYVILGTSYPGAALVVGPILIVAPYTVARALTNRIARLRGGH